MLKIFNISCKKMKFVLKNAGTIGRIGLIGRIGIKCKLLRLAVMTLRHSGYKFVLAEAR